MGLEFRVVLKLVLLLLVLRGLKNDDASNTIAQSQIASGRVKLHHRYDVFLHDLLIRALVSEYL